MHKYRYEGPVKKFGVIVSHWWVGETMAVSESKARSNLEYQFKKRLGYGAGIKVTLCGKIFMVEE